MKKPSQIWATFPECRTRSISVTQNKLIQENKQGSPLSVPMTTALTTPTLIQSLDKALRTMSAKAVATDQKNISLVQ